MAIRPTPILSATEEKWLILDQHSNSTGIVVSKANFKRHPEYYRLAASIWLMNSRGEFLIQKRASTLRCCPGLWSTTEGSVMYDENSYDAALREAHEELGLELDAEQCFFVLRSPSGHVWMDTFFARSEVEISDLRLNPGEVDAAAWATISDIDDLVAKGEFIPARWCFVREMCKIFASGHDPRYLWIV